MTETDANNSAAILIIGGGWAGLAAAVKLTKMGHAVTLLESARQLGGRARRVAIETSADKISKVDNGQHLLIGAYHSLLELLNDINVNIPQNLMRQPLNMNMHSLHGNDLKLKAPALPAPLHLLFALLTASGLSMADRFSALRFASRLRSGKLLLTLEQTTDISVTELLVQQKQTHRLIETFWEPLCLAIMNTPMNEASATVFLRVLTDAFLNQRQDADLLFPLKDLGALFPEPAMHYIEKHGGHVHLGMRVSSLKIENGNIQGVYVDDTFIPAKHLILATSITANISLIENHKALTQLRSQLMQFHFEPVTTIYLQYSSEVHLPHAMQGLIDGCSQWIFDRRYCGQPGLIAVVISSRGAHMEISKQNLGNKVAAELAQLFPHWPAAETHFVIREKRATFSSRVSINALRPDNKSPVNGLWLAGDYTNNGYPATLEGAVRSGVQCAALIEKNLDLQRHHSPST